MPEQRIALPWNNIKTSLDMVTPFVCGEIYLRDMYLPCAALLYEVDLNALIL